MSLTGYHEHNLLREKKIEGNNFDLMAVLKAVALAV